VTLAGLPITQVKSVRVNFGIKAEAEGSDSNIWATMPSVSSIQPVISVTSSKVSNLIDLLGDTGTFSLVYRQRADGGTFGSGRLTLSGSGMANFTKPFGANGNKSGETTLEARPKYDGVNDPIVVTLAT
jgi:hypothetical protein